MARHAVHNIQPDLDVLKGGRPTYSDLAGQPDRGVPGRRDRVRHDRRGEQLLALIEVVRDVGAACPRPGDPSSCASRGRRVPSRRPVGAGEGVRGCDHASTNSCGTRPGCETGRTGRRSSRPTSGRASSRLRRQHGLRARRPRCSGWCPFDQDGAAAEYVSVPPEFIAMKPADAHPRRGGGAAAGRAHRVAGPGRSRPGERPVDRVLVLGAAGGVGSSPSSSPSGSAPRSRRSAMEQRLSTSCGPGAADVGRDRGPRVATRTSSSQALRRGPGHGGRSLMAESLPSPAGAAPSSRSSSRRRSEPRGAWVSTASSSSSVRRGMG